MKKTLKEIINFLSLVLLSLPFVSAAPLSEMVTETVRSTINAAISIFQPLFEIIMQGETPEFLFAKSLLGILLFVIVFTVIKKVPVFKGNKTVSLIIALVVAILAVRFISENDLVNGILLPYGTLGVALTTLLPFLIFFYFVHEGQMGPIGRRALWLVFGIIFIIVFGYKFENISDISKYIYIFTLMGMIIAFIFDRGIHQYFGLAEDSRRRRERGEALIADAEYKIHNLSMDPNPSSATEHTIKRYENYIKKIRSEYGV